MPDEPTLADMLIRDWSRAKLKRADPKRWIAHTVAYSRKFVCDKAMSEFVADLGYCWLPGVSNNQTRLAATLNGYRQLARLPHPVMLIELDWPALIRRSRERWGGKAERRDGRLMVEATPEELPDKGGWLLLQHPKVETAIMALDIVSHTFDQNHGRVSESAVNPLAVVWSVTDERAPWPEVAEFYAPADPPGGIALAPWVPRAQADHFLRSRELVAREVQRIGTNLRFLWSLLAAINDVPLRTRVVRPDGRHMVGGSYKRFVEHTIISLNVPKRSDAMVTAAKRALRLARRRAHNVRGHFRRHYLFPLNPLCEHELEPVADTNMLVCKLCEGRKIWIVEHTAGDATLGWVDHDYNVTHKRKAGHA